MGGLIIGYVGWLISLLFCKGPYLKEFYVKGTAWQSIWTARPFNIEYNLIEKAAALKADKLQQFQGYFSQPNIKLSSKTRVVPAENLKFADHAVETNRPLMFGTPTCQIASQPIKDSNNFSSSSVDYSPELSLDFEEENQLRNIK